MTFQGALVTEQSVTFGIVIVKQTVLQDYERRSDMVSFGKRTFGNIPIVLMAQNSRGVPTYWGRTDIVNFLSRISMRRIPWREYTLSA